MVKKKNNYRNKFETNTGAFLEEKGINFTYESEKLPYTVSAAYIPDFILTLRNGKRTYIETKGNGRSFDGASRRKLKAVKEQHPDIDLRLVFYSNGAIGQKRKDGSRLTQGEWAERNGFKWSIRTIPDEWLK